MLPLTFLIALVALTVAASIAHSILRRRITAKLRHAAMEWRMHYAQTDRFQLTPRVAERFPVPGASDIAIFDLLYRQDQECYRYLFTVEYTLGVVRAKRRIRRVALLSEPRDRHPEGWSALALADAGQRVIEQYRTLRQTDGKPIDIRDVGSETPVP